MASGQTDTLLRYGFAFSPDRKLLASASSDQTVALWDAATGKELHRVKEQDYASTVAFSPDGKTLAWGCHSGLVHLWDVVREEKVSGPFPRKGS